jgi:anhydro-N-acetylmuramic acid kinase
MHTNAIAVGFMKKIFLAIGLMSGTSLDGIDAAILRTDGEKLVEPGEFFNLPYTTGFRERLRSILQGSEQIKLIERELTLLHARAIDCLLTKTGQKFSDVDLIGFHGHTVFHNPDQFKTYQIGDGALLAAKTGIDVVSDLRSNDVAHGGQGAPLVPLYHLALANRLTMPVAILNIGGVSNVTYLNGDERSLIAFDAGPGGALLDDWMLQKMGKAFDDGGRVASSGSVSENILSELLSSPYFNKPPPKSLDRDHFDTAPIRQLSTMDGAATLAAFTCSAVIRALDHLPAHPRTWLVAGGGRKNTYLMQKISEGLKVPVQPVEVMGWDGDALEAQAFSYLAVRSIKQLPITLPGTTGVKEPMPGGVFHPKPSAFN